MYRGCRMLALLPAPRLRPRLLLRSHPRQPHPPARRARIDAENAELLGDAPMVVRVLAAKGLIAADKGGTSDPYATVRACAYLRLRVFSSYAPAHVLCVVCVCCACDGLSERWVVHSHAHSLLFRSRSWTQKRAR